MYESRGPEPGGCRETLLLIRVAFSVIIPPLLAVMGVIVLLFVFFLLFSRHPLLGLLPVLVVVGALYLLSRYERSRDPDLDDLRPPR